MQTLKTPKHLILSTCWAWGLFVGLSLSAHAQQLPNIVLLMGDDHGWEETGYNGHPHVKTPVLDEIARTGLRLERFHSAHPNCSPTRASFLTGRHPNRMGTFAPGYSFRPEEITIAHLLSKAGYRCAHFGKWHVGAVKKDSPVCPGPMGFHEWLSHDNFFELNPTLSRNGNAPQQFKGESSEILVSEAIDFMKRTRAGATGATSPQPFLTVVWFGSPHEPYSGLPEDLALYDDLPKLYADKQVKLTSNETGNQVSRSQGEVLRERYAEITAMDRSIGQLRKYLAESGLRDNTLLFYCGDNGTSADGVLKSPHRGHKGAVYEGGTLVPGLVEWPSRIKQPMSTKLPTCTSDLLPTMAVLTGQALPSRPIDGINLVEAIESGIQERPAPLYFWEFTSKRYSSIKPSSYLDPSLQMGTTPMAKLMGGKATRNFVNYRHPDIADEDYLGPKAIIDGHFKLVVHDGGKQPKIELFDLAVDPSEKNDLANQNPSKVQALSAKLKQWQQSVLQSLVGEDYR